MIKLIDILNEAEIPITGTGGEKVAAFKAKEPIDDEAFKRGYKSIKNTIDPDTGQITTEFEALPKFDIIRRQLLSYRKEVQPFKYSTNEDISKVAKEANNLLTKASQMIFTLDRMLELQRKSE
jgi:hypothetical protein